MLSGYLTYVYRSSVRALTWHLLHGDSVVVADYRVAVPPHWFAQQDSSNDVGLLNAKTGESLWFHSAPKPHGFTLSFWNDVQRKIAKPELAIIGSKEFNVAGQSFLCPEMDYAVNLPPGKAGNASMAVIRLPGVGCKSAGRLDAMFFGGMRVAPRQDYGEFYSIMASLNKN